MEDAFLHPFDAGLDQVFCQCDVSELDISKGLNVLVWLGLLSGIHEGIMKRAMCPK